MKNLLLLTVFSVFFLIQCNLVTNPRNEDVKVDTNLGKMSFTLDMTDAPDEVVGLMGTLTNSDEEIQFDFVMDENSATALVEELTPGSWNLQVDAFNSDSVIIYSGNTEVNVQAGTTTTVSLHLDPVNGSLNIVVTWGSEVPDSALVAFYPFNGNADDESGNSNNAQVNGAVLTEDRDSNSNSAYEFDGIDDYIDIGEYNELRIAEDLTISFWMKPYSFDGTVSPIISCQGTMNDSASTNALYRVYFRYSGNSIAYYHESGQGEDQIIEFTDFSFSVNQWYHVALVRNINEKSVSLYVNKNFKSKVYYLENPENGNLSRVRIGEVEGLNSSDRFYHGVLDELKIYKRILTEAEIESL